MEKAVSELNSAFDSVSPYIERHTSVVCPSCEDVCCINRHSFYDDRDLIFVHALGLSDNTSCPDIKDTDPCRFLGKTGCMLPRYKRPFRCTWYFCDRLLKSMESDSPKEYRVFISALQDLQSARQKIKKYK